MKRPHSGSDVDLRGRVRHHPREVDLAPPIEAKFLDGPCAGTTRLVPRGADFVKVGPFVYSYAGKDEKRTPLYCKHPVRRAEQRFLGFIIAKRGADPRVDMSRMKGTPVKRTAPPAQGRGARRRAERRANAAA